MKKAFKIVLFVGIILAGIIAFGIYWTFYRPLPDLNAAIQSPELQQKVEIYWGPHGIPHIYARDKRDLYFALGYVHAQDRLWQMTLSQMAARGWFAKYFGEKLIPLDKLQRTIGIWSIAKEMEKQLPDDTRRVLKAYSSGVNWYINHHKKGLPIQFSLTGVEPIPWNVTYCLAEARLMAWELNAAWPTELTYAMLKEKLSIRRYNELFPNPHIPHDTVKVAPPDSIPKNDTITLKDSALTASIFPLLNYFDQYKQIMGVAGRNAGSNAWAVDGSRSATGKPILAGDPHLNLYIPGKWYEVHLNLNGKNVSGATIPGNPAVVLGQNDVLAWSFTSMELDDTDFFVEKLDPKDSTRYLVDSVNVVDSLPPKPVYKKLKYERSVIEVKDSKDIVFTRISTKHGPVISDIYPDQQALKGKLITMKWTGAQPSREIQAMLTMDWSQNLKTFKKGVKQLKTPALNVVFADISGDIGLLPAANIPKRAGNPLAFRIGWDPKMDWKGYIPYNKLPKIVNPSKGWVANANNRIEKKPYYLSDYWATNSRFNRIKHDLTQKKRLSVQDFKTMQMDVYSAYSRKMTAYILPAIEASKDTSFAVAVEYLKHWNYKYDKSETAASIFDEFMLNFSRNVFQDEMGKKLYHKFIGFSVKSERALLRFVQDSSRLFDNIHTPRIETKDEIIRISMKQAVSFLEQHYGENPAKWRWGKLHSLTLRPPLLGKAAQSPDASGVLKSIVGRLFNKGAYTVPGSGTTINNGAYSWHHPFEMVHGPSIRRIVSLDNMQSSLSVLPTGQSGTPLSDYYGDQTQEWLHGKYKRLYQDSSLFKNYLLMAMEPGE